MEKELDLNIIKATQTSLGKYVKRPPLSEKLLRKPPFRFLHDIVTSVLKTTGFFEGLFEPDELISDNVKDRESKILFLNKVISVIGLTIGKPLTTKPSKIVAGQEADKTNELLQSLALALDKNLSSDEAVRKYKENGNVPQVTDKKNKEITKSTKEKEKKVADTKKIKSKSSEKLTTNKKETGGVTLKNVSKDKTSTKINQKNTIKNELPPKKTTQNMKNSSKEVEEKTDSLQQYENTDINKMLKDNPKSSISNNSLDGEKDNHDLNLDLLGEPVSKINEPSEVFDNHKQLDSSSIAENQLNSSLSSQDLMEVEENKQSQEQSLDNIKKEAYTFDVKTDNDLILSNNLKTSKDVNNENSNNENVCQQKNFGSDEQTEQTVLISDKKNLNNLENNGIGQVESVPKSLVKTNNVANARPKSVRPSSSRPGAPRLRDKHENIITETENLIVGKVNIIAENTPLEEEEDSSMIIIEQEKKLLQTHDEQEQIQLSSKPHGHLVQQILDSQKEFSQVAGKTEIEWEFGAQRARDAVNKEIEQLRYNIQGLSRVANPLGKILDHIQEDVEVMRQELQQWMMTYDEASKELLKQKSLNEDSLFPLRAKVKQLEIDINEKHEKINDLKIVIHKNSYRVEKLLASGDVQ